MPVLYHLIASLHMSSCTHELTESIHVRECKTVLNSGFHAMNSGIIDTEFEVVVSGTWIRIIIVNRILDSLSEIPNSKVLDSGFHRQTFLGFLMPKGKLSWIPESGFPYVHGGKL